MKRTIVVAYRVISNDKEHLFQKVINELLKEGWELSGDLVVIPYVIDEPTLETVQVTHIKYIQTLVKHETRATLGAAWSTLVRRLYGLLNTIISRIKR